MVQMVKNLPARQGTQVQSLGWEDYLETGMQSNPVFLSGEFHGQRSPVGYRPWGRQELYMNERLTLITYFHGVCSSF